MPDPDARWNRSPGESRWRRLGAALPMRTALIAVASVWFLGCVWSYQEQSAFAASKGFAFPHLLPLVIDGFAVSMAGVAWAASLDARPAVPARLATVVAVAASSGSNGVWAYLRAQHDSVTVLLGVAVPITANLAFEVLLAELRRQVQRRRGLPPPVAVPYPRLIRVGLAPWQTLREWRTLVMELTAVDHAVATPRTSQPVAAAPEPAAVPRWETVAEIADTTETTTPPRREPTAAIPPVVAPPAPSGPDEALRRERLAHPVPPSALATPTNGAGHHRSPAAAHGQPAERRSPDPRVVRLARHLASAEGADELTGEMVGPLLNIDVAPRTGRRLLGQARELVNRGAEAKADGEDDSELSAIGVR